VQGIGKLGLNAGLIEQAESNVAGDVEQEIYIGGVGRVVATDRAKQVERSKPLAPQRGLQRLQSR